MTMDTTRAATKPVVEALTGIAIGSALAWLFVPTDASALVIGVVIAVVAALIASRGGRVMGDAFGISAALWLGYLHTEPRFSIVIANRADVILTLSVLVISVLASELADARHKLNQAAR